MDATDAAASEVRPTYDLDCVVELSSLSNYYDLENLLRRKGFKNDVAGGVICRWFYQGVAVDIMPVRSDILGFSNPWYAVGMETAVRYRLPNGMEINIFTAPAFLATKLEAFRNRGKDMRYDPDFEDIVFLFNNRPRLVDEIYLLSDTPMKIFIREQVTMILAANYIREAVQSALGAETNRTDLILSKLLQVSMM